ncbi:MAG: hypothetical protein RIM23_12550 [Coleofasciculus sp. G3-WIS-01]|uniref:hypothetical protein n=1 Tax=Coleofasciculus sp. G3-WIS-01 TaxID=3069528 RepID=UPI0032FA6734
MIIDSGGNINITQAIDSSSVSGDAGNITLIADDGVSIAGNGIFSETRGAGAGGDIRIQSESVLLREASLVSTATFRTGNAGNLTVETGQLLVQDGSQLITSTLGEGDGGEVNINATEIEFIGANPNNGNPSGLFAVVEDGATGNGGNVSISTQNLRIVDGAFLDVSTLGEGNSGNLTVTAKDKIEVIGSPEGNASGIDAQVNSGATGNAGNVTLYTVELLVSQGGQISVSTFGEGNGGELTVNASQIELNGDNPIDGSPSGLFASVGDGAISPRHR